MSRLTFKIPSYLTDKELVYSLQSGDEAAFSHLVKEHESLVYHTALGLMQSVEDAEDIAQDVFVQVYESIHSFKGDSKLSTWLYRVTITKSLDKIKYKSRKKRGGILMGFFGKNDAAYEVSDFYHPGVALANKERSAVLFKAITTLPDNQRVAFTLNKVEGLSYSEIAEIMNCTVASLEGLLHRAKQNLRKQLADYYK